jgi:hypothetical protein
MSNVRLPLLARSPDFDQPPLAPNNRFSFDPREPTNQEILNQIRDTAFLREREQRVPGFLGQAQRQYQEPARPNQGGDPLSLEQFNRPSKMPANIEESFNVMPRKEAVGPYQEPRGTLINAYNTVAGDAPIGSIRELAGRLFSGVNSPLGFSAYDLNPLTSIGVGLENAARARESGPQYAQDPVTGYSAAGGAGRGRGRRLGPPLKTASETPGAAPPPIGHNQPPGAPLPVEFTPPPETIAPGTRRMYQRGDVQNLQQLPDLRGMPREAATRLATRNPHLIPSSETAEGYFIGGPRDVQSMRGLTNMRGDVDERLQRTGGAGGDWYDRYRGNLDEITGGNPEDTRWAASQHGQWSAGVSPQSELGFVLAENNALLAGDPRVARFSAQTEASKKSLFHGDPSHHQLGEKTGEYAQKIDPTRPQDPTATGVNDFRHARNFGYTEKTGEPQEGALTSAQHRFVDYETAAAVARANAANLGGKSDWTGEQFQAALWVQQKARDIMRDRPKLTEAQAFAEANKTIGDYFDKHTPVVTYEAQPYAGSGHLPGSVNWTPEQRQAYAADKPWIGEDKRDTLYSGLRIPDSGVAMRVRPTIDAQGVYTPPGSDKTEFNPAFAARPLVGFKTQKGPGFKGAKVTGDADRAILDAGEAIRAYVDAQGAGAWHKTWEGGPSRIQGSMTIPLDRPLTQQELVALRSVAAKHGYGDVVDTGRGATITSFYPGAPKGDQFKTATKAGMLKDINQVLPGAEPKRVKVDSGYRGYEDQWGQNAPGSGVVTDQLLRYLDSAPPGVRELFDQNPNIAIEAMKRHAKDVQFGPTAGGARSDIQTGREIMGQGPGWIERLRDARRRGVPLASLEDDQLARFAPASMTG